MANKHFLLSLLFFWCSCLSLHAQEWELLDSVRIGKVTAFAEDLTGKVYLGTSQGAVWRFADAYNKGERFVPRMPSAVTAIDASKGNQVFVHYGDLQQYLLLNRFMAQEGERYWVPQEEGIVNLLCPASDGSLWLLNQSRYSLMRYDPQTGMVLQERMLSGLDSDTAVNRFLALHEHRGRVFLQTENEGLWVFDLTGAWLGNQEVAGRWMLSGLDRFLSQRMGRFFVQGLLGAEAEPLFLPARAGKPEGLWWQGSLLLCWREGYLYRFHKKG